MPGFCNVEITTMNNNIHHNGQIERIENNTIYVRIIQESACSGCHAKGMCGAAESKEKIIEIPDRSGQFEPGEVVAICGKTSLGLQAVLLAFVVPVIIVLAALIIGQTFQLDEALAALAGLLFLVPYYCVLYALRKKLKKHFIFTLKKLN